MNKSGGVLCAPFVIARVWAGPPRVFPRGGRVRRISILHCRRCPGRGSEGGHLQRRPRLLWRGGRGWAALWHGLCPYATLPWAPQFSFRVLHHRLCDAIERAGVCATVGEGAAMRTVLPRGARQRDASWWARWTWQNVNPARFVHGLRASARTPHILGSADRRGVLGAS